MIPESEKSPAPLGWYFNALQPSGTILAIEPNGREHIVKAGDMNTQAGIELLNAMVAALAGSK